MLNPPQTTFQSNTRKMISCSKVLALKIETSIALSYRILTMRGWTRHTSKWLYTPIESSSTVLSGIISTNNPFIDSWLLSNCRCPLPLKNWKLQYKILNRRQILCYFLTKMFCRSIKTGNMRYQNMSWSVVHMCWPVCNDYVWLSWYYHWQNYLLST